MNTALLVPYDPSWPSQFAGERLRLLEALGPLARRVDASWFDRGSRPGGEARNRYSGVGCAPSPNCCVRSPTRESRLPSAPTFRRLLRSVLPSPCRVASHASRSCCSGRRPGRVQDSCLPRLPSRPPKRRRGIPCAQVRSCIAVRGRRSVLTRGICSGQVSLRRAGCCARARRRLSPAHRRDRLAKEGLVACQLSQPDDVSPNCGCGTTVAGTVARLDAGKDRGSSRRLVRCPTPWKPPGADTPPSVRFNRLSASPHRPPERAAWPASESQARPTQRPPPDIRGHIEDDGGRKNVQMARHGGLSVLAQHRCMASAGNKRSAPAGADPHGRPSIRRRDCLSREPTLDGLGFAQHPVVDPLDRRGARGPSDLTGLLGIHRLRRQC